MARSPLFLPLFAVLPALVLVASGCGGGDTTSASSSGTTATATTTGATTGTGGGGTGGSGGEGGILITGSGGSGGQGGAPDPCLGVSCPADQHCDAASGMCANNSCADLVCGPTEICQVTPGGGAVCKDISCTADVDCPGAQFCNGTICVDDVCAPGARSCVGAELHECLPSGSGSPVKYTCGSQSYFTSACIDDGQGHAGCGCEDDWDCPGFTACEVGVCTGTGKAPTCTLPPEPFASVLPSNEVQWGGLNQVNKDAVNAPFPLSSQVSTTPLVVNLDDDNGDGLINELDFPEVVFMTYCGVDISANGIVRAIHGGGPNKGKDFFATCGNTIWHEGDPLNMPCACATGTSNPTAVLAVGDLDGDGIPEIVVPNETAGLTILDNKGNTITQTAANQWSGYNDPAVTLANLDGAGFSEVVVGRHAFTLQHDAGGKLAFLDHFAGNLMNGSQGQGPVSCVANLVGDARQEIIAGTTVYSFPVPPAGVNKIADCPAGAMDDFCLGKLGVAWDGQTVNGAAKIPNAQRDGFCAIADILGADEVAAPGPQNPLDGKPEVILIDEGYLLVLNGETGTLRRFQNLNVGPNGGAPNVDDFDGDGFPEVGTAFGARYLMIDLQDPTLACPAWPNAFNDAVAGQQGNPARSPGGACAMDSDCAMGAVCNKTTSKCVCLHNGWARVTEDDSSSVTGSSVFDFNGDGAAEVVYNDECYFRIYDGTTAEVLFKHNSPSRTRIEHPVVADVDNDGNAEIVFASNNDANACSTGSNFPNGVAIWGDAGDAWVSARRVWNEHAYHVTNVLEGGGIPVKEPESFKTYNGRRYNTYRSNPRSFGVAPDLTVKGVQVSSPDATCGQLSSKIDITFEIANVGDLRVGPGVVVGFYGQWNNPALNEPLYQNIMMVPLQAVIMSSIEPGGSLLLQVSYDAANNAPGVLPDTVRVVVDDGDAQRECNEANNDLSKPVDAGMQLPDLRIDLKAANEMACPIPTVETTVINDGSAPASNVLVRYYAGDPAQGGAAIHDELIAGPIPPGGMVNLVAKLMGFPKNLTIQIYAVVDPENTVTECNDGNNKDTADNKVTCNSVN
jgi:hypothetical protein